MRTIETYRAFGLCALIASGLVALGCSDDKPADKGSTTGAGGGGGGDAKVTYCDPLKSYAGPVPAMNPTISDFDDEAGIGVHVTMPGGIWGTDTDTTGTLTAKVESCGTTGMGFHVTAAGHTKWGADAAAAMVSSAQPVDVSAYKGISFVMHAVAGSASGLFKVAAPYSQPDCGKCDDTNMIADDDCYSGYTKTISTMDGPQTVLWSELSQQMWGYKPLGTAMFDPRNLVSISIAFVQGVDFDICLDDFKLVQ